MLSRAKAAVITMNCLIVVDMQVDFITGSLGSAHAAAIVPAVVEKIKNFDGKVIFTRDTHTVDYPETQEGRKLPVPHCIKDSDGWQICDAVRSCAQALAEENIAYIDKPTFGSTELPALLGAYGEEIDRIELCGLCTDICVISNAMIVKAAFPEVPVVVDASCCAGVTEESHRIALQAMKAVQIEIVGM